MIHWKHSIIIIINSQYLPAVQSRRQSLWNKNEDAFNDDIAINVVESSSSYGKDVVMKTEYLHVHPVCHTPPPSPTAPPSFQALKTFRLVLYAHDVILFNSQTF